jgi:hypothetical protein
MAARPLISHPTRGYLRLEPYKHQASFWLDRGSARAILKSRQAGFSQAIALESLHTAIYQPGSTVLIVSRNLEAATNVLGYVKVALNTPGVRFPGLENNRETYVVFDNGSRILSIAATRSAGRTYAATAVYLDEFAWMPWALDIYQAVAPTTAHGGRLTVLSTPNGRVNPFFLLWQGELGEQFSRHVVPWYRVPPYNPDGWRIKNDSAALEIGKAGAWYRAKRPQYTRQQWATEYGCSFVESGQAVFRATDIERSTRRAIGLQPWAPGRAYVTFWDIGRRNDATVGTTLDVTESPMQVVAWERGEGWPYPHIQRKIEARFAQYPGRHIVESNGVGDPVIENLDVNVEPWVTTAKSKEQMITALQLALERGELGIPPDLRQVKLELLLYQWDDKDLVQDCVMSLAGGVAIANSPRYASGYAGTV